MAADIEVRADVTTDEVTAALRAGLEPRYHVLPAHQIDQGPVIDPQPGPPDTIVVGTGSNRYQRAQVTIARGGRHTSLHVRPGGVPRCMDRPIASDQPPHHRPRRPARCCALPPPYGDRAQMASPPQMASPHDSATTILEPWCFWDRHDKRKGRVHVLRGRVRCAVVEGRCHHFRNTAVGVVQATLE